MRREPTLYSFSHRAPTGQTGTLLSEPVTIPHSLAGVKPEQADTHSRNTRPLIREPAPTEVVVVSTSLKAGLNRVVAVLGAVLVVATVVVFVAFRGSDDGAAGAQQAAAPAEAVDKVQIKDFKYLPAAITVAVGTTITWTNGDTAPHTATSGKSPSPDGVFDTDTFAKGEMKTVKVSKPGTFEYYCELHPFMQATVIVK